ncbi:MAG TPA: NADPH:quinone oxidoreductase family protein [Rhizomicrobium sp.]|jgi:NADPH2:quinone reductase|nr:NADPH:quinone oxidoreductase family protein [Rhizomicrobium sp.]
MLCTHYGPPEEMELRELPSPTPGKNQVLLTVKACGVNFPDVLMLADKYQFKPPLPFPPGGEVAGIVKALGEGVTNMKIGDRVAVSVGSGGFVEEILADARRCVPVPANVDMNVASAFIVTYGTSYHALKDRAKLKPGEHLVVLGAAGGVGLSAVELGVAMGAKVIAGASTQEKVDLAIKHGAAAGFVYPRLPLSRDQQKAISDKIKELTGGQGADVLYDPVGDQYAEPCLRAMNWEGRYLVIGFAAGEIPKIPLNLTLLKGCDVLGVFWGAFTGRNPKAANDSLREIMEMISQGKLHPDVSATFPLAEAGKSIRMLMDRKAMGKVVVTM